MMSLKGLGGCMKSSTSIAKDQVLFFEIWMKELFLIVLERRFLHGVGILIRLRGKVLWRMIKENWKNLLEDGDLVCWDKRSALRGLRNLVALVHSVAAHGNKRGGRNENSSSGNSRNRRSVG